MLSLVNFVAFSLLTQLLVATSLYNKLQVTNTTIFSHIPVSRLVYEQ